MSSRLTTLEIDGGGGGDDVGEGNSRDVEVAPQPQPQPQLGGAGPEVGGGSGGDGALDYEQPGCDLAAITRRQLGEDIKAYRYDLGFCRDHLTGTPDLAPQETRTLQLRILDCGHRIRQARHRIETLDLQPSSVAPSDYYQFYPQQQQQRQATPMMGGKMTTTTAASAPPQHRRANKYYRATPSGTKRQRVSAAGAAAGSDDAGGAGAGVPSSTSPPASGSITVAAAAGPATGGKAGLQRLGHWDCHLCLSHKFHSAGPNRAPGAACKWPLKDVSKMLNHYLDMHTEHDPDERCRELGDALAMNRGPFEYWLTRTRQQELPNPGIVDDYIEVLQSGALPEALKSLNRAASNFPNEVSALHQNK
ncbi:hypothetical protein GGR56DRAFT_519751 [Xylariaceae sp. FL0804]|nr:hypothetical protein GGR56DRAFT_519751 [Xylariaceae sp. FL0804]